MGKHAYLIIIHGALEQLNILIELLDDRRNDIYLHIDSKLIISDVMINEIINFAKYSNVFMTNRTFVAWGGFSLFNAELELIECALKVEKKYDFLHILSGQDLPLKNQDYIHNYFDMNKQKEFIHFGSEEYVLRTINRYRYYYFFQDITGSIKSEFGKKVLKLLQSATVYVQKLLKVDRRNSHSFKELFGDVNLEYGAGANWCSISCEFAQYIISKRKLIKKVFAKSMNVDECVCQMLVLNSNFKDKIYNKYYDKSYRSVMRCIIWEQGKNNHPKTYRMQDYDYLINSEYLFARKFDEQVDREIIEKIRVKVKGKYQL